MLFMMMWSNGTIFCITGPFAGNSPVTGEFLSQRPVTRSCDVVFDLCLNKRLRKQMCLRLVIWDAFTLIMTSMLCDDWYLVVTIFHIKWLSLELLFGEWNNTKQTETFVNLYHITKEFYVIRPPELHLMNTLYQIWVSHNIILSRFEQYFYLHFNLQNIPNPTMGTSLLCWYIYSIAYNVHTGPIMMIDVWRKFI